MRRQRKSTSGENSMGPGMKSFGLTASEAYPPIGNAGLALPIEALTLPPAAFAAWAALRSTLEARIGTGDGVGK